MRDFFRKGCFLGAVSLLAATSAFALSESDGESIQGIINGYQNAWNLTAGRGFADGFTEDADFVNIFGTHFVGKQEIEERHVQILETFLKGSELDIRSIRLREAREGVVVAIVKWVLNNEDSESIAQGTFSHVFILVDGVWQITLTQNTIKPEMSIH